LILLIFHFRFFVFKFFKGFWLMGILLCSRFRSQGSGSGVLVRVELGDTKTGSFEFEGVNFTRISRY
jgi:hypothetical protein